MRARPEPSSGGARPTASGGLILFTGLALTLVGVVLAPALGRLIEPAPLDVWPELLVVGQGGATVDPEPTELVRFALAALTPIVLAGLLLFGVTGPRRMAAVPLRVVGTVGCVGAIILLAIGWAARTEPITYGLAPQYFTVGEALAGLLVAAATGAAASSARVRRWVSGRIAGARRLPTLVGLSAVAVASTVLYVTPAAYTNDTLGDGSALTTSHLPAILADFAAFGNGATPLVDFAGQYTTLLPWALHPVLSAFDYSPASFTVVMCVLSGVALLALWRTLAVAVGNEWVGLALYLPALALALRPTLEVGDERTSNASLYMILPERYLLPLVVAWLCARHVRGLRPHTPLVLFLVAALAAVNNPEFGGPCLLATAVALLVGSAEPPTRQVRRLATHLLGGLAAATLVVTGLALARTGSLPDPSLFSYYSRLYASQGFGLQPMPSVGMHLLLYVTFAGALLAAAARRSAGIGGRTVDAMLAFAGVFGLGASSYYAGRSNAITLVALFPAWGLALALLTWTAVRWVATVDDRRQLLTPLGLLALAPLLGFGLAVTELADAPSPRAQVARLTDDDARPSPFRIDASARFVAKQTEPGEAVLVLRPNGHLVARRAGVRNTSLIGYPYHVISGTQLDDVLADLREAGGTSVFAGDGLFMHPSLLEGLEARGWRPVAEDEDTNIVEWQLRPG